jgi:hypothetical protein
MAPPTRDCSPASGTAGLAPWQRNGLLALCLAFLLLGVLTEMRSAFLKRHMTDLQVYLRAAWAVRTGHDFYAVTDDNDWHYHYPPLFAILLMPFADAPADEVPLAAAVPFAVTVALWYLFSLACLVLAVHWLAGAIEESWARAGRPPYARGCRQWWALRMLPILTCLPPIAGTLARGQVNLLLLLLLCGMLAAALRGRRALAGLWLAGAICLKVIPIFLLVYPLWKRDWRWLAGCAAGLVLGLGVVPAAVLGPQRTLDCYREWTDVLALPGLGTGDDHSRDKELIEVTSTDSQSFVAVWHNTLHLDRASRLAEYRTPAPATRLVHWLTGGVLTLLTLLALGRHDPADRPSLAGLGALLLVMILISPVCHLHYFCLALPLVMGLMALAWDRQANGTAAPGVRTALAALLILNGVINLLPHLPGLELLRDTGAATYMALVLWLTAVAVLCRPGWRDGLAWPSMLNGLVAARRSC